MSKKKAKHETVLDVGVEQLARVYAQAVLDAAGDISAQDSLMGELGSLVEDVIDKFPELEDIFGSALVGQDEKLGILDRLFGSRLSTTALSFLKVMANHGRLGILRQVIRSAGKLWEQRSGREAVELQLAHEVDHSLQREIIDSLRKSLGIDPVVTTKINPDLLAGFVVRVGDKVYDASARTSLERTRQSIVSKAVEAIQSRPEVFMEQVL